MPSYDALLYDPPAPVAQVSLRNPDKTASVTDLVLLIDTGADVTLLPRSAVDQLGIQAVANVRYELASFDGTRSFAPVAILDMIFLNRVYRGRYLLADTQHGVLGRDVLNHLSLLLDGPAQLWSEKDK